MPGSFVPSGLSGDGVPTGLAVVGKTYDDVTAFRIAAAHEDAAAAGSGQTTARVPGRCDQAPASDTG